MTYLVNNNSLIWKAEHIMFNGITSHHKILLKNCGQLTQTDSSLGLPISSSPLCFF